MPTKKTSSAASVPAIPTTHHKLSPSKFPAWQHCACYESDPIPGAEAERGTRLHEALTATLTRGALPDSLPAEDREEIQWAADTIRETAGGVPLQLETLLTYRADDNPARVVFYGRADAVARGSDGSALVFDYKSGDARDYRAQLAAYALAYMETEFDCDTVTAFLVYGRTRHVVSHTFTREDAGAIVAAVISRRSDPKAKPTPCDYCAWCAVKLTCPALTGAALTVAKNREDAPAVELLPAEWHASAISDPVQMARALTLARFVSEWADAVRHHATELAKSGAVIPGYKLQKRSGRREVADIATAFERMAADLPQADFLRCCSLSLPKLSETLATATGTPKAAAAREVDARLADVIREGEPSVSLVKERTATL